MIQTNLETIIDGQMFDRIKNYFDGKESGEVDVSRRNFLKGVGAVGLTAALGGLPGKAEASYDPDYQLPGAVAAEPNPILRDIWEMWHNNGGGTGKGLYGDVKERQPLRLIRERTRQDMESSHVYYILEAKFGLSRESTKFAKNWLSENNTGLGAFRNGSIRFFEDKNYENAKTEFANAIFFSADFNDNERQVLTQMTGYQPLKDKIENNREFNWALGDYFEKASVNDKERLLQFVENKNLPDKDLLNVYWNLGMYLMRDFLVGNRKETYNMRKKGNYKELQNKYSFHTFDAALFR